MRILVFDPLWMIRRVTSSPLETASKYRVLHVWAELTDLCDGVCSRGGFRNDLPTEVRFEQIAQPSPDNVVIVCHHEAQ
jgi:hypothetical protein